MALGWLAQGLIGRLLSGGGNDDEARAQQAEQQRQMEIEQAYASAGAGPEMTGYGVPGAMAPGGLANLIAQRRQEGPASMGPMPYGQPERSALEDRLIYDEMDEASDYWGRY